MAVINIANIAAHLVNYKKDFNRAFGEYIKETKDWQKVSYQTTSTSRSNDYAGLMDIPPVTQWTGARTISNLDAMHYVLVNQDWQVAIEVDRNDFTDDQSGMISERVKQFPKQSFGRHIESSVFLALRNGNAAGSLCWDGQPFFGANHPVGTGVVSNTSFGAAQPRWILMDSSMYMGGILVQMRSNPKATTLGPGSEWAELQKSYLFMADARYAFGYGMWQSCFYSDAAFTEANFFTAYEAMRSFLNADGTPLNPVPDTLIYDPNITAEVRRIVAKGGLYETGAAGAAVDTVVPGMIKNYISSAYLI